jgi:hypothetical protein
MNINMPITKQQRRHCERSEAIQNNQRRHSALDAESPRLMEIAGQARNDVPSLLRCRFNRIAITIFLFLIPTFTYSVNIDTVKRNLLKDMDSVIVKYWNNYLYTIKYLNNDTLIINRTQSYCKDLKIYDSPEKLQSFVVYINLFYIDKSEEIILSRKKRSMIISTDYPNIRVIGYKKGKEMFNKKVQIGEESYDIEYNPEYLNFFELIKKLGDSYEVIKKSSENK